MGIISTAVGVAATLLASQVLGQTPPDSSPSTDANIAVSYGSDQVTPGIMLPRSGKNNAPSYLSPQPH